MAVVGAGVMGAATARALVRSGVSVALLERFRIGHKRGSSHGRSRIFRLSYPDEMYVRMAQEALESWRALEHDSGEQLMVTTGGLDLGRRIEDNASALAACSAAFDMVDPAEARNRFPLLSLPEGSTPLFQPDSGIVNADATVSACARLAARAGATVVEEARVLHLKPEGDRVHVQTEGSGVIANVVVVTAGAWAKTLLEDVGVHLPVRPTRETIAYFDLDGPLTPTLVEWGDPSIYSLPSPGQGIKVGQHIAGPLTNPDEAGRVDQESVETISRWVTERYPTAAPRPHHAETCIYTNTEDEHFILERHGQIIVGSPCSGHGFKFAPLIGERLAALALD
ncbi:MAG: N-methyl-L-tryptophan oxidase [Actinomycetota bacterium]|nr:N-methyl-L-tryptophan oxidase [Actinomycetota bacterium]